MSHGTVAPIGRWASRSGCPARCGADGRRGKDGRRCGRGGRSSGGSRRPGRGFPSEAGSRQTGGFFCLPARRSPRSGRPVGGVTPPGMGPRASARGTEKRRDAARPLEARTRGRAGQTAMEVAVGSNGIVLVGACTRRTYTNTKLQIARLCIGREDLLVAILRVWLGSDSA